ncbi:hypothetical protein F4861DRAFT_404338 [Xylaria intraflava]|nr:hypothetical protein F4861DRAFT_404338 [Xylaria intraflava]
MSETIINMPPDSIPLLSGPMGTNYSSGKPKLRLLIPAYTSRSSVHGVHGTTYEDSPEDGGTTYYPVSSYYYSASAGYTACTASSRCEYCLEQGDTCNVNKPAESRRLIRMK